MRVYPDARRIAWVMMHPSQPDMEMEMKPNQPIETHDGLAEAVIDVVEDEYPNGATLRALMKRLPYGERTRAIVRELTGLGALVCDGMVYTRRRPD